MCTISVKYIITYNIIISYNYDMVITRISNNFRNAKQLLSQILRLLKPPEKSKDDKY